MQSVEITQGFHRTVKNDLVIHHIPGETGPSYGYFTLEPGMVKRSCRISWNLVSHSAQIIDNFRIKFFFSLQHIHVMSGSIEILTEGESETMLTGSFASLHSGEYL